MTVDERESAPKGTGQAPGGQAPGGEIIVCRDVHKWFGPLHVLRGIDLTVKSGEVVVIFGALHGEVDASQHVQCAEPLVDVAADDDVVRLGRDGLIGHGFSLVGGCRGGHRVPTPMARSRR